MSSLDAELNKPLETGGLPVTEFKGDLKDINLTSEEGSNRQRLVLDFTDCEIIETREPYAFPIVQLNINYRNRDKTAYGALKKSWERIIQGAIITDDLKNRRFHMKRMPAVISTPPRDEAGNLIQGARWVDQTMEVWQCLEISGYSTPEQNNNQMKDLAQLANGKTEQEFYMAIMGDSKLKANSELINSVVNRKLIPTMVELGLISITGDKIEAK